MRNVKLVIEYDGTDTAGWQRQDNAPTVQAQIEVALAELTQADVTLYGASRTDAGVHALGQVAHFHTEADIPLHGFRRGLNAKLPPSIAVVGVDEVPEDFHARFASRGKHYRYRLLARPDRAPLHARTAWHRPYPLNLEAMRTAAAHLVGEHDFSAFRAAGCQANTPVRELHSIDIESAGDLVDIHVRGNAFLRNMVRIVAGTLVEVAENRRAGDELPQVLRSRQRTGAGQTAPAHGLCLIEVYY